MAKRSKELEAAYELRDVIADAIMDYQSKFRGERVLVMQQCEMDSPTRASIGQLAVEVVQRDGTHKATTYRSLKE